MAGQLYAQVYYYDIPIKDYESGDLTGEVLRWVPPTLSIINTPTTTRYTAVGSANDPSSDGYFGNEFSQRLATLTGDSGYTFDGDYAQVIINVVRYQTREDYFNPATDIFTIEYRTLWSLATPWTKITLTPASVNVNAPHLGINYNDHVIGTSRSYVVPVYAPTSRTIQFRLARYPRSAFEISHDTWARWESDNLHTLRITR